MHKSEGPIEFRLFDSIELAALGEAYSALLFPSPLSQTQGKPLNEPLLCIVASHQEKPIGLILCEPVKAKSARIICWCVLTAYRNRAIGKTLLELLEKAVKSRRMNGLVLTYRSDLASSRVVEKVLKNRAWSSPQVQLKLYKITIKRFLEPTWFSKIKLPNGYEIFPWRELSAGDRKAIIKKQNKTGWYPEELTPFQEESRIEWSNSLGLRYRDKIIGWLITHRVAPDVIQYSALFVSQEHKPLAVGLPLIIEAVRRHCEIRVGRAIFQARAENRALIDFVERRLGSMLDARADRLISMKELQ